MKIANIVCTYPPYKGGIGTNASNFRAEMVRRGHTVVTFVPDYGLSVDTAKDKEDGVKRIKPLLKLGNGAFLPQLFFLLKDFEIIYLHYPFFGGAELVYFFKLFFPKKKLVIRYHMDVIGLSPLARILSLPSALLFNSIFKKADMVVSASLDYIENGSLAKVYHKYKNKFVEIPYGIDTQKFLPKEKTYDKIKILFVGGLDQAHYFKGVDNLIKAVARLNGKTKNVWELNIVGDGDLRRNYEEEVEKLGVGDKVNFLGGVSDEDLVNAYAQNHLTVLPSINKNEAFGIVLTESMSSGTPILASDLAGVRSVFGEKEGEKVEPNNVEDLTQKLISLIDNPERLKEMAVCARERILRIYDKNIVGEKLEKKLIDLLKK